MGIWPVLYISKVYLFQFFFIYLFFYLVSKNFLWRRWSSFSSHLSHSFNFVYLSHFFPPRHHCEVSGAILAYLSFAIDHSFPLSFLFFHTPPTFWIALWRSLLILSHHVACQSAWALVVLMCVSTDAVAVLLHQSCRRPRFISLHQFKLYHRKCTKTTYYWKPCPSHYSVFPYFTFPL